MMNTKEVQRKRKNNDPKIGLNRWGDFELSCEFIKGDVDLSSSKLIQAGDDLSFTEVIEDSDFNLT